MREVAFLMAAGVVAAMLATTATPTDVYQLVDERTNRTKWILFGLCVLVVIQIVMKWFETRRVKRAVDDMSAVGKAVTRHLEMAAEHGRITDGNKVKTEQVVSDASARAGVAAEKAGDASRKVEDAVATLVRDQEQMARELHALADKVDKLVRKVCPDDDDSFHGGLNTGA